MYFLTASLLILDFEGENIQKRSIYFIFMCACASLINYTVIYIYILH
jgi:hypothetical protein